MMIALTIYAVLVTLYAIASTRAMLRWAHAYKDVRKEVDRLLDKVMAVLAIRAPASERATP